MTSDELDIDFGADERRFDEWYQGEYRRVVALVSRAWSTDRRRRRQDAFLGIPPWRGTISSYANPGGWVRKVAMNKAQVGAARRRDRWTGPDELGLAACRPNVPEPSHGCWRSGTGDPGKQAQVKLHRLDAARSTRIAAVLEISTGTVATHLHVARAPEPGLDPRLRARRGA